jgi:hypothetical protein
MDAFSTGTAGSSHAKGQTLPVLLSLHTAGKLHHLHDSSFFIHGTVPLSTTVEGKVVPVLLTKHHTMKAYWGSGCIAPLIL